LSEEETFYLEHYMLNDDPLKYLPENDPFYEALLISMTPNEWKKGFAEGGRVGYANGEEVEEDLTEQLAMLKKIQETETQYETKDNNDWYLGKNIKEFGQEAKETVKEITRDVRDATKSYVDKAADVKGKIINKVSEKEIYKDPIIRGVEEKQIISDERLAEHKEYVFNLSDFNITNPNRIRNHKLLEDVIWHMESDRGNNPDIELNGPYQISKGTQKDAVRRLKDKHSKGKGLNFSKETIDYLEKTPRNEMQDNASRLLMNHTFFTRAVKDKGWTQKDKKYIEGEGTKLLQAYHENPTWEKAQDIYLKLWVYHTKEEYAEIMEKQTGDAVDIGPNLLRGKKYFNQALDNLTETFLED